MTPDRYAVLGNPVAHSRSPFIHALFAQQTGQAVDYGRLLCPMDGFDAAVRRFAAEGGRKRCTERATLAGAANVLRFDADGWLADNTDGVGLMQDIEQGAGLALAGKRVLLIGAGGAAAGVLGPLLATHPAAVVVANRTAATAHALVARHAFWAAQHGVRLVAAPLATPGEAFDVVINASASSLQGAGSPVPATTLRPGTLAVDLMYGPAAEPFMAWAGAAGATPRDGLGMLVEQAAEAFALWRGVRPATAPVLQALRQALASA